jgi:hypothetical protein
MEDAVRSDFLSDSLGNQTCPAIFLSGCVLHFIEVSVEEIRLFHADISPSSISFVSKGKTKGKKEM